MLEGWLGSSGAREGMTSVRGRDPFTQNEENATIHGAARGPSRRSVIRRRSNAPGLTVSIVSRTRPERPSLHAAALAR